jgi:hypothetical protein
MITDRVKYQDGLEPSVSFSFRHSRWLFLPCCLLFKLLMLSYYFLSMERSADRLNYMFLS